MILLKPPEFYISEGIMGRSGQWGGMDSVVSVTAKTQQVFKRAFPLEDAEDFSRLVETFPRILM